jgi:hypothetical protein
MNRSATPAMLKANACFRSSAATSGKRLLRTYRVADGRTRSEDVTGTEFNVVVNVVKPHFRSHEEMAPDVVSDAASHIDQEVMRAREVVTGKSIGTERKIEPSALPADPGQQFKPRLLAQFRLIHGVEIQNNRPEGLTTGSTVGSLAGFPGSLKIEADAPVENHVCVDVWVQAALFRNQAARHTAGVRSTRQDSAEAERSIALLRLRKAREETQTDDDRQSRCLSQENLQSIDCEIDTMLSQNVRGCKTKCHHSFCQIKIQIGRFSASHSRGKVLAQVRGYRHLNPARRK